MQNTQVGINRRLGGIWECSVKFEYFALTLSDTKDNSVNLSDTTKNNSVN